MRPDGTSYFARVEEVEPTTRQSGGVVSYRVWGADRLPVELPNDGLTPALASSPSAEETPQALRDSTTLPGLDGLRVNVVSMPPGWTCPLHWHDTFDVLWIISGEAVAILDDGSEQLMRPGDFCLCHGTNHAWRVGDEGAVVGSVRLGVNRVGPLQPPEDAKSPAWMMPDATA